MNDDLVVLNLVNNLCNTLNISRPKILYSDELFKTDTMLAAYENGTLYLRKLSNKMDLFFAISHELRHIWQKKYHNMYYFFSYKPREAFRSSTDYSLQIAEIDANAFATIVMTDTFKMRPTFDGMSERVRTAINNRIEYIYENGIHSI